MAKVIIIGGGVSGMAAGIYAQMSGLESEIYESHTIVGGQCTGWQRKGYHIDNCVHWLTGTKPGTEIYQVWNDVGVLEKEEDVIRHEYFLRVDVDGKYGYVWRDVDKLEKELLSIAPEDKKEIKSFIKVIKKVQTIQLPSLKPKEQMSFGENMRLLRKMYKAIPAAVKYGKLTMSEYADKFKSPILKRIMINYLPSQYNMMSIFYMYAMFSIGNADLPKGGSSEISSRMENKYLSKGGKIFTKKKAKSVDIENKKITRVYFEDGTSTNDFDYVIFATDADVFFRVLGKQYMDPLFKRWYSDPKGYPVSSNVNLYYSVDRYCDDIPELVIFKCEPYKIGKREHPQVIMKNFFEEKSYAPEGKTVVQVLIVQDMDEYDFWENLYDNNREAYKSEKERLGEEIKLRLEKHFPQLTGKLNLIESVTPKSFNRYCGSYKGSYMGFVQTPYAKKIIHPGVLDGLDNLYLAGQWLQAPGGLPNAVITGRFAVQRLLKRENMEAQFCSKK